MIDQPCKINNLALRLYRAMLQSQSIPMFVKGHPHLAFGCLWLWEEFLKHSFSGIFDLSGGCRECHLKFLFCPSLGMKLLGAGDNMQPLGRMCVLWRTVLGPSESLVYKGIHHGV